MSSIEKLFVVFGSAIVIGEHPQAPLKYVDLVPIAGGNEPVPRDYNPILSMFRKIGGVLNLSLLFCFGECPPLGGVLLSHVGNVIFLRNKIYFLTKRQKQHTLGGGIYENKHVKNALGGHL